VVEEKMEILDSTFIMYLKSLLFRNIIYEDPDMDLGAEDTSAVIDHHDRL
jgi:hypothetical protein